jgi:hypothetical protein
MFSIFCHKGKANQNYTESPPHPGQIGNHQENKQQQMLVRIQGQRNPSTLLEEM